MAKTTYTLEPQRLISGRGYVPCEPHQACRVVIWKITSIPSSKGRRAYRQQRIVANFSGAGAMTLAREEIARLTGKTKKPEQPRSIWGRSLTLKEFNEVISRRRTHVA